MKRRRLLGWAIATVVVVVALALAAFFAGKRAGHLQAGAKWGAHVDAGAQREVAFLETCPPTTTAFRSGPDVVERWFAHPPPAPPAAPVARLADNLAQVQLAFANGMPVPSPGSQGGRRALEDSLAITPNGTVTWELEGIRYEAAAKANSSRVTAPGLNWQRCSPRQRNRGEPWAPWVWRACR